VHVTDAPGVRVVVGQVTVTGWSAVDGLVNVGVTATLVMVIQTTLHTMDSLDPLHVEVEYRYHQFFEWGREWD